MHVLDPCSLRAVIFAPSDECFATAMMFKASFVSNTVRSIVIARSVATKQSMLQQVERWIASLRSQ
jgi:hypothetical protein